MRIQHNIPAMSAYRNYTNNVSAMKKNLEKLSSGYKINRAGDDAAGLAISEKMRAQITGLETAQKNAKDGISLVQTAEGALTEVHDMLNRMVELATMSANGTYDNNTDRAQLEKELNQLKSEIDRIADSSNFNGLKLLDGSLGATSTSALGADAAQLLSSLNGSAPTKAGAAEIIMKLANNASSAASMDPTVQTDGQAPSKATAAKIEITMGTTSTTALDIGGTKIAAVTPAGGNLGDAYAAGATTFDSTATFATGDVVKVGGKTYTCDTSLAGDSDASGKFSNLTGLEALLKADGYALDKTTGNAAKITQTGIIKSGTTVLEAGTATVADLKNLVADATNTKKVGDLFDISIAGTDNVTDATVLASGAKITLTAKVPGAQHADVATFANGLTANGGAKAVYTAGVNEGDASSAPNVTKYDLSIDISNLRGGMYMTIGSNKITFCSDGTASTVADTADMKVNLNGGQVDTDLKAALDKIFSTTNKFDPAKTVASLGADGKTYTYKAQGDSNANIDTSNMGEVRVFDADGNVDTSAAVKSTYSPAAKDAAAANPAPGPFAKVTYEIDPDKLANGSKFNINGHIIEIAATADLAKGKITKANFDTEIVKALEQMGYDSGKVKVANGDGTNGAATGKYALTIEGTTIGEKASDLLKGAGAVSFLSAADAPASEVTVSGATDMTITAGKTTIANLKNAAMPSPDGSTASVTMNDLFNITVNGNTMSDNYVIAEGDEIKFTAKNNGQLAESVMNKFNFEGKVDSLTKKNGWDEGSGATGDKTHYELAIDLARTAGGNSFTFGNVNGKSVTFDLSYDSATTDNDTIGVDKNDDISGNNERVTINLYGLSTQDAQQKIFDQVKSKMGTDFDVTRAVSGSKMTLTMDAKKEGSEYNLGNIRVSSASGALTNAVYEPAGGNAGGTPGTMAQVTYKFDVSQLAAGDTLTIGGTSIQIGETSKKETVDGNVKITVGAEEAKADPNKAIVEALESAGYRSGQVKFDTSNNTVTITGIKTGETAAELQAGGAKMALTNSNRKMMEGGLTLQIGDTADSYNQLTVDIQDMHAASLGLDKVSVADQDSAATAVDVIKAAINQVSDVRGTLGATQNRLDHTINNLSVMTENIQDAESTIRDVDVAEEMMAYTKNNILIQSAQAMLAQANQMPQGVLQLLG